MRQTHQEIVPVILLIRKVGGFKDKVLCPDLFNTSTYVTSKSQESLTIFPVTDSARLLFKP